MIRKYKGNIFAELIISLKKLAIFETEDQTSDMLCVPAEAGIQVRGDKS